MKKVVNIISVIFILLLFYLTKNENILPLTVSFSMYTLYSSIFSAVRIKNNNYKIFKYSVLAILIIGIPLIVISYAIGEFLDINKLNIINIFMVLSLLSNIILKMTNEYLEKIGCKKLNKNLINTYKLILLIVKIILIILFFGIFSVPSYINIILLYSVDIIVTLSLEIIIYLLILKKTKKKSEEKINYIPEIKNILINNKVDVSYKIINSSYIYISIIFLYYILSNKYNYSYDNVGIYITNIYFYGLLAMYYIYKLIKKYLNINIDDNFNNNINRVIKVTLPISILLIILSEPLSKIIFNSSSNILIGVIPLLFVYIFYDFIMNTSIRFNNSKKNIIILIIGLIIKIIFELPLINAIYRMGYSLELGSTLSISLGLIITIILGIIFIKNKLKLSLLDNFNNLLNIVYENIIYTLILVLFTFIVKTHTDTFINSLLVIMFYLFITFLFYLLKRILTKK